MFDIYDLFCAGAIGFCFTHIFWNLEKKQYGWSIIMALLALFNLLAIILK